MGLIDRLKTDPEFKTKFLRATIFFTLFIAGLVFFAFTQSGEEKNPDAKQSAVAGGKGWIPGDSTGIDMQKNEIYQSVLSDSINRRAGGGGAVLGGSITENQQAVQAEDKTLDNYMAARQQSINRMQNSGTSYSSSSESYSYSTPKRRSYNPNGSSSDWSSVSTSVTGEKVISSPGENPSQYRRQLADNTPEVASSYAPSQSIPEKKGMSDLERRRLLLQTGKRNVENTANIKANIDGSQIIKNGQLVKIKTTQDAFVSNKFVPKFSTLYGTARFDQYRVSVDISSIKVGSEIIGCQLSVYGMDGQPGIPVTIDALSESKQLINDEIGRNIGGSRTAQVISSILMGNKRNDVKVKLLNNQNIILVQK